ncbi:hypothetical protein NHG29_03520 [Aerococcaceae bacterium NML160702]|nr:hypothetical protein [Aerococcaceae bacterium NML160702]
MSLPCVQVHQDGDKLLLQWKNCTEHLSDIRAINSDNVKRYHKTIRRYFQEISAGQKSRWYYKNLNHSKAIDVSPLVIVYAIMHRLSELSRYEPKTLYDYLSNESSWVITEFIKISPFQFINGITSELTGEQLGISRNPDLI